MKMQIAILSAVAAVLILSSLALAQPYGRGIATPSIARTSEGYHLTRLTWQVNGIASGGGYRLTSAAAPALTGNGCCCLYLPLLIR